MISYFDIYGLINATVISQGRYGKTREILWDFRKEHSERLSLQQGWTSTAAQVPELRPPLDDRFGTGNGGPQADRPRGTGDGQGVLARACAGSALTPYRVSCRDDRRRKAGPSSDCPRCGWDARAVSRSGAASRKATPPRTPSRGGLSSGRPPPGVGTRRGYSPHATVTNLETALLGRGRTLPFGLAPASLLRW